MFFHALFNNYLPYLLLMTYPVAFDKYIASLVAKIPKRYFPFFNAASIFGGSVFSILVIASTLVWALVTDNNELLSYTLVVALCSPIAELMKYITRRTRPETLYAKNMKFKSYSFPSGHSYVSALICGFVALLLLSTLSPPLSLILALIFVSFSITIGISRIYLGAHFPSDVVAGWTLGLIVLLSISHILGPVSL